MKLNNTETTRYLCAAAYSNEEFCEHVINQTLNEDRQALAPCYGFDLPTVLKHCLIARSKKNKRDIKLTLLFIFAILCSLVDGFWGILLPCILEMIVISIIYQERWEIRHFLIKYNFSKKSFTPDLNIPINHEFHQKLNQKFEEIEKEQNKKIVIYGRYLPFVGCGYDLGGWTLALDISKGKENLKKIEKPTPFQTNELYDKINSFVDNVNLYGINVSTEDTYYIDGRTIRDDTRFLSDPFARPLSFSDILENSIEEPAKPNRFYKRIEISGWKGELIVSIMLRFTKFELKNLEKTLFIEAKYFLLPPLQRIFYEIDSIQFPATFMQKVDLLFQSFLISFFIWPLSFAQTAYKIFKPIIDYFKKIIDILIIKENPGFNYGSITSIRENFSDTHYRNYFQFLDQDMYLKVIENALFEGIVEFLDSKNIDTSELKNKQSKIINEGIIMTGGEIRTGILAIGRRARAIFNKRKAKTIKKSRR
ncbi:MAG: hypothetical protein HC836_50155 [Richelia sp. RM2_1_2]|nr:hypothetical protein [Richelia sp. RM1_1_1]NJO65955.1 hypothetical protein [Richelia sp. RM2_1_2]